MAWRVLHRVGYSGVPDFRTPQGRPLLQLLSPIVYHIGSSIGAVNVNLVGFSAHVTKRGKPA